MAYIITENCTGCTACMKRCPTDAITGERKLLHVIDPELCIDCGACGVVCPDEAIYDHEGNLCDMLKANSRPIAFVDLQSCVGCEWCVWACPFDALVMGKTPGAGPNDKGAGWEIAVLLEKKCVGCTLCELDCPYDAIHIFRKDSEKAAWQVERNTRFEEEIGVRPVPTGPNPDEKSGVTSASKGPLLEFAKGFPDDPELGRIVRAFEAGDYRTVRDEAPKLADRTKDPLVREAALDLRRRIDPDPIQLYLIGLTFALLAFLTAWFYLHRN